MAFFQNELNNQLHGFLAFWLHRLSGSILHKFEKILDDYDLTHAQWCILQTIYQGTSTSPKDIAEYIGVDAGSISRSVERLVKKGFLIKEINPEDTRSVILKLSPDSQEIMIKILIIANEQELDWTTDLNKDEVATFINMVHKLLVHQGVELKGSRWKHQFKITQELQDKELS